MPKLHLQTIVPLGIIAATLINITVVNLDKPSEQPLNQNTLLKPKELRLEKPGAQITLESPQRRILDLFAHEDIVIKLLSHYGHGTITVNIKADDGIRLATAQNKWQFELTPDTKQIELPVSVYANSNGIHYIHIFTEYTNDEGERTVRALANEVKVGESDTDTAKYFSKNNRMSINTVQGIVSLPSKESIF